MRSTSLRLAAQAVSVLSITFLTLTFLTACGKKEEQQGMPPAEVGVITVEERPAPMDLTYMARTAGVREVEVRARVGGILQRRQYEEGSRVREGQLLFRIEPANYDAEAARSRAQVAVAQAAFEEARRERDRLGPLVAKGLVSRRENDEAISAFEAAEAALAAAKAAQKTSDLNLSYTEVRAPISGLTSRERRSEGSLITMDGDSNLLTRIVQTDPLYIEFSMPAAEAALVRGSVGKEGVHVVAVGADGKELPHPAKFTFIDTAVEPSSGLVQARATMPNADNAVLPGQFMRARIVGVDLPKICIVPARSVMRSAMGSVVFVVGEGDVVQPRPVQLGDTFGNDVAVLSGVKAGERVVADGLLKLDLASLFNPENKTPVVVKAVPSGQTGQPPASPATPGASPGDHPAKPHDAPADATQPQPAEQDQPAKQDKSRAAAPSNGG